MSKRREGQDFPLLFRLEDTAHYAGLLLVPAEGFGQAFFVPWGPKRSIMLFFGPFKAVFGCSVVTLVAFSSILSNFENDPKNP